MKVTDIVNDGVKILEFLLWLMWQLLFLSDIVFFFGIEDSGLTNKGGFIIDY